jgi:C-1 hydroxylase
MGRLGIEALKIGDRHQFPENLEPATIFSENSETVTLVWLTKTRLDKYRHVKSNSLTKISEGKMKNLFLVSALVILFGFAFGCQNKAEKAELEKFRAQAKLEEENTALTLRLVDAWIKGDIDTLREILSPDYVYHNETGMTASLEMLIEQLKKEIEMFPDRTMGNEELIAKGDKVVHRYIARGTHTGEVDGLAPTGNKLVLGGVEILRFENGKIVESWEVLNYLSLFAAIGFELKPREVKK